MWQSNPVLKLISRTYYYEKQMCLPRYDIELLVNWLVSSTQYLGSYFACDGCEVLLMPQKLLQKSQHPQGLAEDFQKS